MNRLFFWLSLLAYRLFAVFFVISWFVPDEVYQSVEVAHKLVYGSGHISWEWEHSLRSYLHPLFIASILKPLQLLGLDSQVVVYQAPRIAHSILFSISDVYMFNLCVRLCHTRIIAKYAFFAYMSSWFVFYCSPRTLANSLETVMTIIALHWYPFEGDNFKRPFWPYIALGVLTIVIRPTVALLWLVFGLHHLYRTPHPINLLFTVMLTVFLILSTTTFIDSFTYNRPVFPMWNFLMFNVLEGGSASFGVHPWHWYLSQGLPAVLTIQLVPILYGVAYGGFLRPTLLPLSAASFYIVFHSLLPHKEHRFLLPIIPLVSIYTGVAFYKIPKRKVFIAITLLVNLVVVIFTSRFHQVGPLSASYFVTGYGNNISALMPCFSIPGHSFHHDQVNVIHQLDCSPNFVHPNAVDESDSFHQNPIAWLNANNPNYTRIVMYEKMYDKVSDWFKTRAYTPCARLFHSIFLTSSREDNFIVVLCKN